MAPEPDPLRIETGPAGPATRRRLACSLSGCSPVLIFVIPLILLAAPVEARREALTTEQKERLRLIDRVLVQTMAITEQAEAETGPLAEVVARRLGELGYTIVTDPRESHDVALKLTCTQRKVWEGTTPSGGDADIPDAAARLWAGPACQFTYVLSGASLGWRHEVRTKFEDAQAAAREAGVENPAVYALTKLRERLEEDAFPFMLAAEWGQHGRLLKRLDAPATTPAQKIAILSLLGDASATESVPHMIRALRDQNVNVARAAVVALGSTGDKAGIPALLDLLKAGPRELRPAAATGLGRVAPLHPEMDVIPALLTSLDREDVPVRIEIVWALGKLADRRARQPLINLNRSLQALRELEIDPRTDELKSAVAWSLKQIDRDHTYE